MRSRVCRLLWFQHQHQVKNVLIAFRCKCAAAQRNEWQFVIIYEKRKRCALPSRGECCSLFITRQDILVHSHIIAAGRGFLGAARPNHRNNYKSCVCNANNMRDAVSRAHTSFALGSPATQSDFVQISAVCVLRLCFTTLRRARHRFQHHQSICLFIMLRRTHYSQSIDAERNLRLRKTPDEIAIKILHFEKSLGLLI